MGPRPKREEKETHWAIKKPDSEAFTRYDIQYQVLHEIFDDRTFRFTAPVDQAAPPAPPVYLNFDQLYLEAVLSSLKTTQNLRQKLIDNPNFAIDFCKVCLLLNCGRFNTTLAFYPTMKTALRTYHPIPSLMKDESSKKDLQDAPRLKGILKACFLDWEVQQVPTCLKDIAKQAAVVTRGPPTTVVTAIFHMFYEANWVTERYFKAPHDLQDIFYPSTLPSLPRAHAFLSLLHRVLESGPKFLADFDVPTPNLPILLDVPIDLLNPALQPGEKENVDLQEELDYAKEMKILREGIVKTVPAMLERDKAVSLREQRKKDGGNVVLGAANEEASEVGGYDTRKRARGNERTGKSWAKSSREEEGRFMAPEILPKGWEDDDYNKTVPTESSLPSTWRNIKRDFKAARDPDYDSEEEEAWAFDLLRSSSSPSSPLYPTNYQLIVRRTMITVRVPSSTDPTARATPKLADPRTYNEWKRRKEGGFVKEESVLRDNEIRGGEGEIEHEVEEGSEMND